jgi:hypothetical protein
MKFRKILVLLFLAVFAAAAAGQSRQPQTLRDFFLLLSQKYFYLEDISENTYTREQLERAQKNYLETFLEIEDRRNGFMQGGCDGSQECFKMALFKRSNGTYIAGLNVFGEWGDKYYFLEYRNGKLRDVSKKVVPGYKRSNMYMFPRYGTTTAVVSRKNYDPGNEVGDTGRKLYDLAWKNDRFRIVRRR